MDLQFIPSFPYGPVKVLYVFFRIANAGNLIFPVLTDLAEVQHIEVTAFAALPYWQMIIKSCLGFKDIPAVVTLPADPGKPLIQIIA